MTDQPYPTGFLSWGGLPGWKKQKPCRYCSTMILTGSPHPVCTAEQCRASLRQKQLADQRRYNRRAQTKEGV